jgi:hypothetical protein
MRTEDTGHFLAVRADPAHTLPPLPTPGIGATLLIATTVILLRLQGTPDEIVDQWRNDALAAIKSPSILPIEKQ